jgi:hypothetical protein
MCEQCNAETVMYVKPNTNYVLPGYFLVRATKDGRIMKKDDWGLVQCNDPDFIWSITPVCDPDDGLSDEQVDELPDDKNRYTSYWSAAKNLSKALNLGSFDNCVRLGEAMKKAGWVSWDVGYGTYWLCNHIAKFLKTANVVKDIKEHID